MGSHKRAEEKTPSELQQVVRFVYAHGDSYFFDGLRKDLSQWKDPGGMLNNNPDASIPENGQHSDDQSKCKSIVFHNRMEVSHVFPPPTTRRIPTHGITNFMLQQGCHMLELACSFLMILILRIESAAVRAHWIIQNATIILATDLLKLPEIIQLPPNDTRGHDLGSSREPLGIVQADFGSQRRRNYKISIKQLFCA
ncbi:hypothetical protein I7I51_07233 [Histoplasma capsulatum]|uniref:Uncharacterized protein n=1 Tax=Ajellomyces capsulatus TaxID=5037 RepID=A0A8A1MIR2_AJECA|nr:predicted protein [Histoplasma mississippiense (nom. inval.)]EDN09950.1 predicted protein [Histoplasma mississippiense (nom. inval.)]QSS66376.1 hypothetical protein I7I51_07233 [Histoplasma capsulatum]